MWRKLNAWISPNVRFHHSVASDSSSPGVSYLLTLNALAPLQDKSNLPSAY
ncbi:hypothetical protein Mapa_009281 [Marchantia paleacea]|nr:hypothetical protein Mapa_009281 [Marchantia paleacea]